jgi:hypothetical protein
MNFKGVQTLWENMGNFPKFYLDVLFTKVNLVAQSCMRDFGVLIEVPKGLI